MYKYKRFGLGVALAAALCSSASAAQFTTDTLNDDASPHSLRTLVKHSQWGDVIVLGLPGTITLSSQIVINHDLTITAVGAPRDYLISGNGGTRLFGVWPGLFFNPRGGSGPMPTLTISNLTLCNGYLDFTT